jgi:hypothetical protein
MTEPIRNSLARSDLEPSRAKRIDSPIRAELKSFSAREGISSARLGSNRLESISASNTYSDDRDMSPNYRHRTIMGKIPDATSGSEKLKSQLYPVTELDSIERYERV